MIKKLIDHIKAQFDDDPTDALLIIFLLSLILCIIMVVAMALIGMAFDLAVYMIGGGCP